MKKLISLLIAFTLVFCVSFSIAEDASSRDKSDFGYSLVDASTIVLSYAKEINATYKISKDSYDVSASSCDITLNDDTAPIYIGFHMDPATKLVTKISVVTFNLSSAAYNTSFMYGRIISNFANADQDTAIKLGLDNTENFKSGSKYTSKVDENGYGFSVTVDMTDLFGSADYEVYCTKESETTGYTESTSNEILQKMIEENALKISASFMYDKSNDANSLLGESGGYVSKINFAMTDIDPQAIPIADLSTKSGGSIEVFENEKDAIARRKDIETYYYFYPDDYEYIIQYKNFLLRITGAASDAAVGEFATAFLDAVKSL